VKQEINNLHIGDTMPRLERKTMDERTKTIPPIVRHFGGGTSPVKETLTA
jgi:hypothetical protein